MPAEENLQTQIHELREELVAGRRRSRALLLGALVLGLLGAGHVLTVHQADRFELTSEERVIASLANTRNGPVLWLSHGELEARYTAEGVVFKGQDALFPVDEFPRQTLIAIAGGYADEIEVTCRGGYRNRAKFLDGLAHIHVPEHDTCKGHLKGGAPVRFTISSGETYRCSMAPLPMCRVAEMPDRQ